MNRVDPWKLRIAIASSGLGHIRRGVETWADDLGAALGRRGLKVTTFQGSAGSSPNGNVVVPCMRRFDPGTQRLASMLNRMGGWRAGIGSGYGIEQTTFALNLWRRIGRSFDIVHVQDPQVALLFEHLRRMGISRPRAILGHGTEESAEFLRKLSYLQHLAPNYRDEWEAERPKRQLSFAVPNFVDTERFRPAATAEETRAAREAVGLAESGLAILSVGALKKHHKRVDYLMREFAAWRANTGADAVLVVVGAREAQTPELHGLRAELGCDAITLVENAPRERVLTYLLAADVFTLASLHEMMPIAVLEAIACGLPVACNADPTLEWMVGPGGRPTDISQPGGLQAQFAALTDAGARAEFSAAARHQAETLFSEEAVVKQVLEMYSVVAGSGNPA